MRKIGTLPQQREALTFSNYLHSRGIANQAELNRAGEWEIWVTRDDQLTEAENELEAFREDSTRPEYQQGAALGKEKLTTEQRELKRSRAQVIDARTRWGSQLQTPRPGAVTGLFVAASVMTFILQYAHDNSEAFRINIEDMFFITHRLWPFMNWDPTLPEVRHGEVWRLFTPCLLHFGILHILFNMMWLYQLGSAIEHTEGPLKLLFQILVIGILSNVAQFYVTGPTFGGMSGVVYGLFGFTWMCAKYDPGRKYFLDRNTVTMMIIWFFLCMANVIQHVANTVHGVGLAVGIIWGGISVRRIPFTNIRF